MEILVHLILCAFIRPGEALACSSPLITQAVTESTQAVTVSWLDFGNGAGTVYELEFVPQGSAPTGIATMGDIMLLSAFVTGLTPGTTYNIYLRAVCTDGPSAWYGPVQVTTHIANLSSCGILLDIPDNNCPAIRAYGISVNEHIGLALGTGVFLQAVDVIIEHPWMADLSLWLRSPTGKRALLVANKGVGIQNIGNPEDSTCTEVLTFTPSACSTATFVNNGQTGTFLPEQEFSIFHDQGSAFGTWFIEICDRASDDIGSLRFVHLRFTTNACDFPPSLHIAQVLDTLALIGGMTDEECDSLRILVWNSQADTTEIILPCSVDPLILDQLLPGYSYNFIAQKICDDHVSAWTCEETFETTCASISLWSGFDNTPLCMPQCDAVCAVNDTIWTNTDDGEMHWIAYTGSTPTEFTGPSGSRFQGGRYLYIETSGAECQDGAEAHLASGCIAVSGTDTGCDLSFWYHMYGVATGSLILEITVNGGGTWDVLWQQSGNHADQWHYASISLAAYNGMLARFRMRGIAGAGFLGDIAIDDITFYGSQDGAGMEICYYRDADMDGYGDPFNSTCLCASLPPDGYTTVSGDCDDNNPDVSPGATEIPCNLIDDDCNGIVDDEQNPNPITYTVLFVQNATCSGIDNGIIAIEASGGLPPYQYQWTHGGQDSIASGLKPGIYQCSIADQNGCIMETEYFQILPLVQIEYFIITAIDPTCTGRADGLISGVVQGGLEPYQFNWSHGAVTQDVEMLPDGVYQVTVTDAQGCSVISELVELRANTTISASVLQLTHVSCSGDANGLIRIAAGIGAVQPVSYLWSTGDTTALITGLSAGSYTCVVTDSVGCTVVAGPYRVREPVDLEVQVVVADPPLCASSNDGSIQLSVNGGTPPYFYTWSTGAFSDDLFHLAGGDYTVTVTDVHGCDTVITVQLLTPDTLSIIVESIVPIRCPGENTGAIVLQPAGGTPPYRFDWSTGAINTNSIHQLPVGFYSVTLSDSEGCKSILRNIQIELINTPLDIRVDTFQHIGCHGESTGFVVVATDGGTAPYWFNWSAGVQHQSNDGRDTLSGLPAGNYRVTITDAYGCVGTSETVILQQPSRLQFALEQIGHNICYGYLEGAIEVRVTGGTTPYHFLWSNGAMTEDITDLAAGLYSLTITDSAGCILSTPTFEVLSPDEVVLDFETTNETGTMMNGTAEVIVTGGTPPYTYRWDANAGGQTTRIATQLSSGTYSVFVTDDTGCIYAATVFVDRTTSVIAHDDVDIHIYPNPVSSWLYLVFDQTPPGTATLYGMDGQVYTTQLSVHSSGIWKLPVHELTPGVYLLRLSGGHTWKVVVAR